MPFCYRCGKPLSTEDVFCSKCGVPAVRESPITPPFQVVPPVPQVQPSVNQPKSGVDRPVGWIIYLLGCVLLLCSYIPIIHMNLSSASIDEDFGTSIVLEIMAIAVLILGGHLAKLKSSAQWGIWFGLNALGMLVTLPYTSMPEWNLAFIVVGGIAAWVLLRKGIYRDGVDAKS